MMLLQLLLLFLTSLAAASPGMPDRSFTELLISLSGEYEDDMEAIKESEQIYLAGLAEGVAYVEEIELLIGEEDIEEEDDEVLGDSNYISVTPYLTSTVPDAMDARDAGIMHAAVWQGAGCGSCGWIAGVQTLEARMALVSENYVPYSIQNFMNCVNEVCKATQPYKVQHLARNKPNYIVPEYEMPYTRKECLKTASCQCAANKQNYTRVTDQQFAFIGPTLKAETEQGVVEAMQTGPLTTCFAKAKPSESTERCTFGCGHSNSIIGYTKDKLILQESIGVRWGKDRDGSWSTTRGTNCSKAVVNKAYYPLIFYDYDRANAFFTETAVEQSELNFLDKDTFGITDDNTKNIGVAKNKCAYLGSACKGVVTLLSGAVELVADFGAESSGTQKAFKKTQMVIYLKHEETGKYIGISTNKGLKSAEKDGAAPFFTSHARFISFDFPEYHIVDNTLEKISGGIPDIDVFKAWTLKDCNLYSAKSGMSLDIVEDDAQKKTFGGNLFNKTLTSQRFDIGISGEWLLKSKELGLPLKRLNKKKQLRYAFEDNTKYFTTYFRWNARQMMTWRGKPIDHRTMKFSDHYFDISNTDNAITPTDCTISKLIGHDGAANHMAIKNGKVVMSDASEGGWTFEYADL